ncbi:MAG: pantoate--beta-alanine ligase, partial [Deltaproteobacteria bacterium]|nr:pantoate--beta-alanine ligase [Deltaproteobacteria bacterium]
MIVVKTPADISAWSDEARARGQTIAFVPTMGALHEGHVALLREGRRRADLLALSIFVNPTQFGPREDLDRYPRDLEGDLSHASGAGVDVTFVPDRPAMYPPGHQTTVQVHELEAGMCGDLRPGHFVGVATVVCKLFNLVRPHVAIFGEKDFQQLAVIRRMVRDLDMPVDVVGIPTVREPDGLALSSRNRYLSPADRKRAVAIPQALVAARLRFQSGDRDPAVLAADVRRQLELAVDRIDYVDVRDAETLRPAAVLDGAAVLAVAVHVGPTRLIDNVRL